MNTVTRDLASDAQALVLDGVVKSYGDVDVIHGIDLAIRALFSLALPDAARARCYV